LGTLNYTRIYDISLSQEILVLDHSLTFYVVGPCHHGVVCCHVVDGGDNLQIWIVAAYVLNKKSQTANSALSSCLVVE